VGGAITSVLPVLALHTWPGQEGAVRGWTGWTYLSRRRVAMLAGLNKDSVGVAYRHLVALKLMELDRRPRERHQGGVMTYYRLATSLYPEADEPYALMPGTLIYGGVWAMLPSPAFRHLYLVIACLDAIGDEAAYLARIGEDLDGDWDRRADDEDWAIDDPAARAAAIQEKLLAAQRARHPLSMRDLVGYSGLQRSTVIDTLRGLFVPMFGNQVDERTGRRDPPVALLKRGEPQPQRPTWYAVDRRAWRWYVPCEVLNSLEQRYLVRDRFWPRFVDRWVMGQLRIRQWNSLRLRRGR
jgi:hypothetical protein